MTRDGDDEVHGDWTIDDETRARMRLAALRKASEARDWGTAQLDAEELLDEVPDHVEALHLLGRASLELNDAEGARMAFERALELTPDHVATLTGLAVARYDLCDLPGAAEAAREATRLDPGQAEAHFYLGLSLERVRGRSSEALTAFVSAHRLDADRFPLPLRLAPATWQRALDEALAMVPRAIQRFWEGVPMVFEEHPDIAELAALDPPLSPSVAGAYLGERPEEADPWELRPKRLRLYTANLSRASNLEEVVHHLAEVLQNEALDWLDLTLEDLEEQDR